MILSDRTISAELEAGRIVIDPLDETSVQPSSVDLHVDRYFRVFRNHTMGYIDVKENQEDLTELVEIGEEAVFILHPGEFVLGSTAERVQLPDDLVARLEGKALALDTPVPTPNGWWTMGELRVGDEVFDERGRPTSVIGTTAPMLDQACREVVFADGATVVADARHQWLTCDRNGGRAAIRTTDEIAATLPTAGPHDHHVPLTEPVEYPARDLPADPYVEGLRLVRDPAGASFVPPGVPDRGARATVGPLARPHAQRRSGRSRTM